MRLAISTFVLALTASTILMGLSIQTPAEVLTSEFEKVASEEIKTAGIPGAAVCVVDDGKTLMAKGIGVASIETGMPVTADTLFRLGSTTKMFTAAALVRMALDGKIDLRRPIGEYVKGLDGAVAQLTVDQLLAHTAGLQNDDPPSGRADETALEREVRSWTTTRLFAPAGDVFSYSNLGYWLAGYVAEAKAGKPYATVVEDEVLKPLGMNRSTFRLDVASTFPLAQGHRGAAAKATVVRPIPDNPAGWPSGALYSTATDLCRWLVAFVNHGRVDETSVLPAGIFDQLAAAHAEVPSGRTQYGYGLSLVERRGFRMLEHGGSRAGYGSFIRIVPEKQFALAVMTNGQGHQLPRTVERISELALPLQPRQTIAPPEVQEMTVGEMAEYVGLYKNTDPAEVFVRDANLFLRVGKTELQLSKIGTRRLLMREPGAATADELVMIPDKSGRIQYIQTGSTALRRQAPRRPRRRYRARMNRR